MSDEGELSTLSSPAGQTKTRATKVHPVREAAGAAQRFDYEEYSFLVAWALISGA